MPSEGAADDGLVASVNVAHVVAVPRIAAVRKHNFRTLTPDRAHTPSHQGQKYREFLRVTLAPALPPAAPMRAVIADDDPVTTAILSRALADWGFDVTSAPDGTAAWTALTSGAAP